MKALLLLVALVGTAGAQAAQQEMSAADANKWIGFFDKLVVTVVKPQPTCEKLALDVSSLIDQNREAIAVARSARAARRKLPDAVQQRMLEGVRQMVPVMKKCGENPKVKATFSKLDLNRRD